MARFSDSPRYRLMGALLCGTFLSLSAGNTASAQERFPEDRQVFNYQSETAYRDSESHPLRIAGYILHPIGWAAQELIFRPLSYFISSTETSRKVFGYREPFDFRKPECFSSDSTTANCQLYPPFNYGKDARAISNLYPLSSDSTLVGRSTASLNNEGAANAGSLNEGATGERQVYLPDVNFDFNSHKLTTLGDGKVRQIAQLLNKEPGVTIVLEGNADQVGTDAYNEKLGLDRAEAVRSKLIELGIGADRLSTVSFGKSRPVFGDEADWARAVNRRVGAQSSK